MNFNDEKFYKSNNNFDAEINEILSDKNLNVNQLNDLLLNGKFNISFSIGPKIRDKSGNYNNVIFMYNKRI